MAIIQLPKAIGDIQEAQLMAEDYYTMRITQEPTIEPNRELKNKEEGKPCDESKCGHNLILKLRVEHEDPMLNGRFFTKYLPLPKEGDESNIIPSTGQSVLDSKLETLRKYYEAFSGQLADDNMDQLSFEAGQRAALYVSTGSNFRTGEAESQLDFNKEPKPIL